MERTGQLIEEKKKTDALLERMLPGCVHVHCNALLYQAIIVTWQSHVIHVNCPEILGYNIHVIESRDGNQAKEFHSENVHRRLELARYHRDCRNARKEQQIFKITLPVWQLNIYIHELRVKNRDPRSFITTYSCCKGSPKKVGLHQSEFESTTFAVPVQTLCHRVILKANGTGHL